MHVTRIERQRFGEDPFFTRNATKSVEWGFGGAWTIHPWNLRTSWKRHCWLRWSDGTLKCLASEIHYDYNSWCVWLVMMNRNMIIDWYLCKFVFVQNCICMSNLIVKSLDTWVLGIFLSPQPSILLICWTLQSNRSRLLRSLDSTLADYQSLFEITQSLPFASHNLLKIC